jgi:3-methyladenine DNA glycosylase/8-oxoguanine DNA glycosylase
VAIAPVHFSRSFHLQQLGRFDPTAQLSPDCFRRAVFYRNEPAAVEICRDAGGLQVTAYGGHAQELLDETVIGLEQDDSYSDFATEDSGVFRLHKKYPGLRLLRVPWLYDMTCSAILQQRVRTVDAMRDWRRITLRWGTAAPLGLHAFPPAQVLAQVPMHGLQQLGLDPRRARTLLAFARELRFTRLKSTTSFAELRKYLSRIPGIGPWTTECVLGYGAGDIDAAIPGDLHLPRIVCYALAGEFSGSDERMMELLEPFRGHRFRIIRLLYAARIDVPW